MTWGGDDVLRCPCAACVAIRARDLASLHWPGTEAVQFDPATASTVSVKARILAGGHTEITILGDPQVIPYMPGELMMRSVRGAIAHALRHA